MILEFCCTVKMMTMNGIKKCEMFREIRKRLCENNGIPFIEEPCPTPNKRCIGTCPDCDHWLERLNALLELKVHNGEKIRYDGVEQIYREYQNKVSRGQDPSSTEQAISLHDI